MGRSSLWTRSKFVWDWTPLAFHHWTQLDWTLFRVDWTGLEKVRLCREWFQHCIVIITGWTRVSSFFLRLVDCERDRTELFSFCMCTNGLGPNVKVRVHFWLYYWLIDSYQNFHTGQKHNLIVFSFPLEVCKRSKRKRDFGIGLLFLRCSTLSRVWHFISF